MNVEKSDWSHALTHLFFSVRCVSCRGVLSQEEVIRSCCSGCEQQLYRIEPPACLRCGRPLLGLDERLLGPLPSHQLQLEAPLLTCERCLEFPPLIERAKCFFAYAGLLRGLLHQFKYRGHRASGLFLRRLFRDSCRGLEEEWREMDWVIPVPLSPQRLRKRGFNQAWSLLKEIEGVEMRCQVPDMLWRSKATIAQHSLSAKERFANLFEAFECNPRMRERIVGAKILLVDDVLTTGATVEACAQRLLDAGASSVYALTLCRGIL